MQGERGAKKNVSSEVGNCSWVPFYMTRGNMGMFRASKTSDIDIAVGVKQFTCCIIYDFWVLSGWDNLYIIGGKVLNFLFYVK